MNARQKKQLEVMKASLEAWYRSKVDHVYDAAGDSIKFKVTQGGEDSDDCEYLVVRTTVTATGSSS